MRASIVLLLLALTSALALENPGRKPPRSPFGVTPSPTSPSGQKLRTDSDPRAFVNAPNGAGMKVQDAEGNLDSYTNPTLIFPAVMVADDLLDGDSADSPVVVWPDLDTEFIWITPRQGYLVVKGPLIPGQTYRFRLREGLQDREGQALDVDAWGLEMTTPEFRIVQEDYGQRTRLNARPQVPLSFNYPLRIEDAAEGVWFQDRVSRKRFPAEILLNRARGVAADSETVKGALPDGAKIFDIRVRPLEPLPVGRRVDLVVEDIRDAYAGRPLLYPQVFPLGRTVPLEVVYVTATNRPLEEARLEVKFSDGLADTALPDDALSVSPEVPDLRFRKEGSYLVATGKFEVGNRYTVEVSDQILGQRGYGLPKIETWGATLRPTPPTVLFPAGTVRERSALGLRLAFYQINTGALEWKLARIPLPKLPEVLARNKEFEKTKKSADGFALWTKDGYLQQAPTEKLISAFNLEIVGSGSVPAAEGGGEVLRKIEWQPDTAETLSGPMLLEMSGLAPDGRRVGNRMIIYFGEIAVTRKVTRSETVLRLARMSSGEPIAGAEVLALNEKMEEVAREQSDDEGGVSFPSAIASQTLWFQVNENGTSTLQEVSLSDRFRSGNPGARSPPKLRAYTFTDRPLYRPGQEVVFKGMVRLEKAGRLEIPAGRKVEWRIESRYGSEIFATGKGTLDKQGGWDGAWTPPVDGPLGHMAVKVRVDGAEVPPSGFQIEEFRNPLFSVVCRAADVEATGESVIEVQSQYFHGAPNAAASLRWTATWLSDSSDGYYHGPGSMTRVDLYSEEAPSKTYMAEVSGEAVLDRNGQVTLRCDAPFPDPGNRARCYVAWKVELTGPDGQTLTGGASQRVPMAAVLLGLKRASDSDNTLAFKWDAETPFGTAPSGVQATLFRVETKSVKERLAPDVYRYRNFDRYVKLEQRDRVTDKALAFEAKEPGRYVLVVAPLAGEEGMVVSEEAYLSGAEASEVPVQADTAATVFSLTGGRSPEHTPWKVGDTAVLTVLSPSTGVAWVTVETDQILDSFTQPIEGNTTRIEIPVKAAYEPNVQVSVYILRPGGPDQLAGEMFGSTTLAVVAPDRRLDIAVSLDAETVAPREKISGKIKVVAGGKPVAGADLAIYAVDDAILELGGWRRPRILRSFFPSLPFGVATYSALDSYVDRFASSRLTEKGFVIGDGGDGEFGNITFTRKEFKPRLFWKPSVRTDSRGEARFSTEAPDNLTRFRVIAIGQTKKNQFGSGDATFKVSKNLLIDPALPRFVREGDEVELRAVARQKIADEDTLAVRCTVGGALELLSDPRQEVAASKDAPAVVRFRARATGVGPATVTFDAISTTDPKLTDSVEVTFPVAQPLILKKAAVAGPLPRASLDLAAIAPADWRGGTGTFRLAASSTPWLTKLMGLPYLLDYPHGCLEQQSSRLLACTRLGGLLEYLPEAQARRENYETLITQTFKVLEASLLPGDRLPYWPMDSRSSDFVTIQAAWCVASAEAAGFPVPQRLASALPSALEQMLDGETRSMTQPSLRAFAIFVLSQFGGDPSELLTASAEELYLRRDRLSGEGRAFLALALQAMNLDPAKQKQLLKELPKSFDKIAFNPGTFSSATRTEALCAWARLSIEPDEAGPKLEKRLNTLLESTAGLSTQENLWLLVAFDALLRSGPATPISQRSVKPAPSQSSANGTAVAWDPTDLAELADWVVSGLPRQKRPGSYVLKATYSDGQRVTELETKGMRVERVVQNLTEPGRTGSKETPFQLGDQLLITYRVNADKAQSYVALEDLLPGGIEVVNPNLALFGKHFSLPDLTGASVLNASHTSMRDQQTNLYFDDFPEGGGVYAVLARATAAGSFIWPAAQIQPMYDSRFFGRSPSGSCTIVSGN